MDDIDSEELASIIHSLQNTDVITELAKEICHRQANEKLLVMILDRILQLEVRLREYELPVRSQ